MTRTRPLTDNEVIEEANKLLMRDAPIHIGRGALQQNIENRNINKLIQVLQNHAVPLDRPVTPSRSESSSAAHFPMTRFDESLNELNKKNRARATQHPEDVKYTETRPARTLDEFNSILADNSFPPAHDIKEAHDIIKHYGWSSDILETHTKKHKPFNELESEVQRKSREAGKDYSPIEVSSDDSGSLYHELSKLAQENGIPIESTISEPSLSKYDPNNPLTSHSRKTGAGASHGIGERRSKSAPRHRTEEEINLSYLPPKGIEEKLERSQRQILEHYKKNKPTEPSSVAQTFDKRSSEPFADIVGTEAGPKWHQESVRDLHKAIFKAYGADPFIYPGSPVVEPSPLEKLARTRLSESSPFSEVEQERHANLNELLSRYSHDKTSERSTKKYLDRLSQNPAHLHKELMGDVESDIENTIRNQANRDFLEKILPTIKSKYQTPGLRQHGHMGKDINEAVEKHGRGVTEALSKEKVGMRHMTLGHANQYGALQAHAAGISQKAATKDRKNELEAINTIENARKIRKLEERAHINDLERIGSHDAKYMQDIRNQEMKEAERLHQHPIAQVRGATELIKGIPLPIMQTSVGNGPERPHHTQGQTWTAAGQALSGLAGNLMPQTHKKGGRIKKAIGGQVNPMQDVVQNAVIDRRSPVDELRSMIQHARGVQGLEGRQHLKIGGSVDPIKQGAEDANMYSGHASMKKKLERMRNPSFGSALGSAANIDSKTPGWFADSLRAFHRGYDSREKRIDSADDLEYELQEKLEVKAEREREMARKDKMDAEQIAHMRAQNALLGMQGNKLQHEISGTQQPHYLVEDFMGDNKSDINNQTDKTVGSSKSSAASMMLSHKKQDVHDKKTMDEAIDDFELAEKILTDSKGAFNAFSKIQGNQILGGINSIAGNQAASFAGKLVGRKYAPEDIQYADTAGHSLYGSLQSAEKSPGRIKASVESALTAKPSINKEQRINLSEIIKHSERAINVQKKDIQSMIDAHANPRLIKQKIERLKNGMQQVGDMKEKYQTLFPVKLETLNPNDISKMSNEELMSLS